MSNDDALLDFSGTLVRLESRYRDELLKRGDLFSPPTEIITFIASSGVIFNCKTNNYSLFIVCPASIFSR